MLKEKIKKKEKKKNKKIKYINTKNYVINPY